MLTLTVHDYVLLQVWVGVLPTGPSGYSLCSDYKSRDDDK
jgi:hypothetical protein